MLLFNVFIVSLGGFKLLSCGEKDEKIKLFVLFLNSPQSFDACLKQQKNKFVNLLNLFKKIRRGFGQTYFYQRLLNHRETKDPHSLGLGCVICL